MIIKIAGSDFNINGIEGIKIPDNINKFIEKKSEVESCVDYNIYIVDECPICYWKQIIKRDDIIIYRIEDTSGNEREARSNIMHTDGTVYAFYVEDKVNDINIYIRKDCIKWLNIDTVFLSLFAFERQLIKNDLIVLHCAYVVYNGKALLFSGPSGMGKTTQADLWVKYKGARVMNGDRAVIGKEDGIWYAYGWPVCGSSEICFNEKIPIEAIVLLGRNEIDEANRASTSISVKSLYREFTINSWNEEFVDKVFDIIENIVSDIPIIEFNCTMKKSAVECLYKYLKNK